MSRGDITTKTTEITLRLMFVFYDNAWDFKDNRDNRNNRKNRRNCGCHEVTYNKDNGDYSAPDVSFYDNAWDF